MEPDVIPLHSSSPPPLDDDGDGEVASEDDEFGDFGGFSVSVPCSPLGSADAPEPPSPTLKPATRQTTCSFNQTVEQSQPTSTVNMESDRGQVDCDAKSSLHLTNGFADKHLDSGAHSASIEGARSPEEETGFADFTVFTDQAAHPWCCGFSPMSNTEQWEGRVGGRNHSLGEQICNLKQDVIMESEPRSHCACKANKNVCTEVEHCENRDAARAKPSQDHHQPQEAAAAAAFNFPSGEEELGEPGDSQKERRCSFNSLQISEVQEDEEAGNKENSISSVPQTFGMYESASEASFGEDFSFEGVSADLEPNVSSLDQTDWDRTDDEEDDELGLSDPFVNSRTGNLSQSESERAFRLRDQYATQETCATSNQSRPGTNAEGRSADGGFEHHRDQELVQTADAGVQILGNLPPSDSFADFCSAPTQDDGQGSWAEFKDQGAQVEGKTWPQFKERVSILEIDGDTEEEQDGAGQDGGSRRNSCQASLSCRVLQLLQSSFPEVAVPTVEGEEELLSLCALLQTPHPPEKDEEEAAPELSGALWIQQKMLSPHRDVHSAVGLQFQWGGSYTNRTLLRCLGVDTRNIVFIGMKKQPVTVPAFASGLGMLEPTKDSVPAVGSPGHTAVTAQAPPGHRDVPDPLTHSVQEELPSSQLDWSNRGLSSSQDGTSPRRAPHFWGRK